jgi:hypothetical protein
MSAACTKPAAVEAVCAFLVDDRRRSDDTIEPRGDPGGSQCAISAELGRVQGVGGVGRGARSGWLSDHKRAWHACGHPPASRLDCGAGQLRLALLIAAGSRLLAELIGQDHPRERQSQPAASSLELA